MAGPWPSNTALPTTNLDADTDTVTGAEGGREQLYDSVVRLNSALAAIDPGATPFTTANPDNSKADAAGAGFDNEVAILDSSGNPISSGKTHVTTLGTDNNTVPTSKAVADAIAVAVAGAQPFQASCIAVLAGETFVSGTNISSVTWSSGTLTINFTTNFVDTNYIVSGMGEDVGQPIAGESPHIRGIFVDRVVFDVGTQFDRFHFTAVGTLV